MSKPSIRKFTIARTGSSIRAHERIADDGAIRWQITIDGQDIAESLAKEIVSNPKSFMGSGSNADTFEVNDCLVYVNFTVITE